MAGAPEIFPFYWSGFHGNDVTSTLRHHIFVEARYRNDVRLKIDRQG